MPRVLFKRPTWRINAVAIAVMLAAVFVWGVAGFGGAAPALAEDELPPAVTAFTHVQTACVLIDPGVQEFVDGFLVITGFTQGEIIESDEPRIAGTGVLVVDLAINLSTGGITFWGTSTFEPDAIDGTWEGTFSGEIPAGGFASGTGISQGTGDLEGQQLVSTIVDGPPGPNPPCAIVGNPQQGFVSGVITAGLGGDDDDDDDDDDEDDD